MTNYLSPEPLDPRLLDSVILRRAMALFLDWFCMGVVFWTSLLFIGIFGIFTLGAGWLAFHFLPFLPFAYYALLIGGSGATPGQRLMDITLRRDTDLAAPSLAQALVWTLLLYASFALAGVPFLFALLNPHKRAMHDILSGLTIIRAA
jgi:uncharacterized RDD family membrane protein YckC